MQFSVCLSLWLSVLVSVCLPACLFVCLSVSSKTHVTVMRYLNQTIRRKRENHHVSELNEIQDYILTD